MKIEKINKKDNVLEIFFDDVNYEYLNELRRLIKTEVPTMTIEDIDIHENTSGLYDDIIAQRLGLTVLKTDLDTYVLPEECTCGGLGCARCQVYFSLKQTGPKMVYAKDLQLKDPSIKVIYENTPIIKLLEGQTLDLEGVAILGKGKEHMKWSAGHVYYQNLIKIKKVNEKELKEEEKSLIKEKLSNYIDSKYAIKKEVVDEFLAEEIVDSIDAIEKEVQEHKFRFVVESWGSLSPENILVIALDLINKKSEKLSTWVKAI